jgi:hypothetical protein
MPESFKAALISFADPGLTTDQQAHLQRWAADDRAEEDWQSIERAAQENNRPLPEGFFIREILAAKRVAISIGHRWKYRERYRKQAEQMERIAKFLREPRPAGIPPYPPATELARMLDEAAHNFRREVAVSKNLPGVLKFSRKSKPPTVFMSIVGNDLNNITGCWLDQEVAALTEIAFNAPEIDPEDARWARRRVGRRKAPRKARR